MVTTKQIKIKSRTYYFYNDLTNIKHFDTKLLKLDKKSFKNIGVYYIEYITKKGEYKINSVNPLYLLVHRIEDSIEEKEGSKYLNIASTLWIAPAESRSVRGASHQPIFMGDCLTICHTYLPCLPW